jgi:hypothetical protein
MIKINPLNILQIREVHVPAPHFQYIVLDVKHSAVNHIREWIYSNLKHRFYIGEVLNLENNQFVVKIKIGFETPAEASFFLLACPHLK